MRWLFVLAVMAVGAESFRFTVAVPGRGPVEVPVDGAVVTVRHRGAVVASQISEGLEAGVAGTVMWFARGAGEYTVTYEKRPYLQVHREPVGLGDALFYNRAGGFDSLGIGMKNDQVLAVDWDGDGRTDLLQRNIYSATFGEPWWGLYFWRNIGTEERPRFERAVRVRAGGEWLQDFYASYQLVDWDGDGLMDVLCGVGAGKERGRLKVFRNTGARDVVGLPVLAAGVFVGLEGGAELTYGMRLLGDWLYTLKVHVAYFPKQETWFEMLRHKRVAGGFGKGEAVTLGGVTRWAEWPSDVLNGSWIGATRGPGNGPLKTCIVRWGPSAGCLIDVTPEGFAIPLAAAPWAGIFVSHQGSWLRWFVEKAGGWVDQGMLLARGQPVSSGGYTGLEVADWDGDGDLDLVLGNETGFVHWFENLGGSYAAGRRLAYAGRSLFINDEDPERPFGQAKPMAVDWDGDGDLDLLVGNNSNRIAYFERGRAGLAPMVPLRHDGGERFSFRAQPAAVDWNGDGLMDLVAGTSAGGDRNTGPDVGIAVYLRYRGADGALRLGAPSVLKLVSGEEIRTPIPYHHGFTAVDWDGDGDLDLFCSEKSHVVLYRNEGGRFRREPVLFYGAPLSVSHHETSVRAVDWDGDGKLDLLLGGESGRVYYFHRSTLEARERPKFIIGPVERLAEVSR